MGTLGRRENHESKQTEAAGGGQLRRSEKRRSLFFPAYAFNWLRRLKLPLEKGENENQRNSIRGIEKKENK